MSGLKDLAKQIVGRVAELAMPGLAREIDQVRNADHAPRLKRAILYSRLRRAHARGDKAAMEQALAAFWRNGPGDAFHGDFADARIGLFREHHADAVDELARILDASNATFSRLVEIGCGDGRVLADCIGRLPSITRAIGLDINASAIARAAAEHSNPRLAFAEAEARAWLAANPQPGTVLLSNGGVLEYFSPENVDALLAALATARPAAAMLIEPASRDHDLAGDASSKVFGHEYSFSHNYRHRLEKAGFRVAMEQETEAFGARLMVVIGILA